MAGICPACLIADPGVYDVRSKADYVRRRRRCDACGHKWTTYEVSAEVYATLPDHRGSALRQAREAIATAMAALDTLQSEADAPEPAGESAEVA